jgi:glucokinase
MRSTMILAGDVGGTKTLVGAFNETPRPPTPAHVQSFPTQEFSSLEEVVRAFLATLPPSAQFELACFGVAGPVLGRSGRLTNVPWRVSADDLERALGVRRVHLLNDLEAMAYAVPVLRRDELHSVQRGSRRPAANAALIAAGTGLGECILHNVDGQVRALASEAGHADFAARTDREIELFRFLRESLGRVQIESVVSGPGLQQLHRFTHREAPCGAVTGDEESMTTPARISRAALQHACERCVEALELFVSAYGAAAGNLGLRAVATGGVYIGGGIAPHILPALTSRSFLDAFNDKPPMRELMASMPVDVILNPQAALLGAAVYASRPARG